MSHILALLFLLPRYKHKYRSCGGAECKINRLFAVGNLQPEISKICQPTLDKVHAHWQKLILQEGRVFVDDNFLRPLCLYQYNSSSK